MSPHSLLRCLLLAGSAACARDSDRAVAPGTPHDVLEADIVIGSISDDRPEYEFGRVSGIVAGSDGGVVVADHGNDVVRVYDPGGRHRYSIGRRGAGPGEVRGPCCVTAMRTVERQTPAGVARLFGYQPHGPSELHAHAPGGEFAHALSSRYAIDWRDAHGRLIRYITHDTTQGPPLSERERAAASKNLDDQSKWMNVTRAQLGFDVPSHKPPLSTLFFDRDGRLWVEFSVADGADPTAHVYDRNGTLERSVTWPHRVDLSYGAITRDAAWGVATDSLDVASVVRLRGLSARR